MPTELAKEEPIAIKDIQPDIWYALVTPNGDRIETAIMRLKRWDCSLNVDEDIYISYSETQNRYFVGKISQCRSDKCCIPMLIFKKKK